MNTKSRLIYIPADGDEIQGDLDDPNECTGARRYFSLANKNNRSRCRISSRTRRNV